jgi:hypothetical protein
MLSTIRLAVGEVVEEGLADIIVEEEERKDSARLVVVSRATRRLIRRAFKTARPGKVGSPALEAVNRRETGEQSNKKPFYTGQKVAPILCLGIASSSCLGSRRGIPSRDKIS